jgi:hypothetical protein
VIDNLITEEHIASLDGPPELPQEVYLGGGGERGLSDLRAVINDDPDAGYCFCAGGLGSVEFRLVGVSGLDVQDHGASGSRRIQVEVHDYSIEKGGPRAAW